MTLLQIRLIECYDGSMEKRTDTSNERAEIIIADILPSGRFGFNQRKVKKSLDLAHNSGINFGPESGPWHEVKYGSSMKGIVVPPSRFRDDLSKIASDAWPSTNTEEDKELRSRVNNIRELLAAQNIMDSVAGKLAPYTASQESGFVAINLEQSDRVEERPLDHNVPRHWQGDLRSGNAEKQAQVEAQWVMGGGIVALRYSDKQTFHPDEAGALSRLVSSQYYQVLLDYDNEVAVFGAGNLDSLSDISAKSAHCITRVLEDPRSGVV